MLKPDLEIETKLNKDIFLAESSLKILNALSEENALQRLVEIGYEILGNPFAVIDMSFKIIAITDNSKIKDDPVWNEFVINGYTSLTSAQYYANNKFTQMVLESDFPFFWSDSYVKYPRIMGKVAIGGKPIAILGINAHERPFKETDLEVASILTKAFSIELQKNKFIQYSQGLMHENFIEDLVTEKIKDGKIIEERIKTLNLNFRKNLYTITMDSSNFDKTKASLTYLRNQFEQMIPNSKAIIHDDKIVLVSSCENKKQFFKSEIEKLRLFLKSHNIYAGISRCFYSLEDVREHYLQSSDALRLGMFLNSEEYFFPYEEYALYHFTESCSGTENMKKNCHPSLLKLIEYDQENNTDYTRSLYAFIIHSKNITESAKALNIHRNTMFYRLEKIESIMDLELNNSNTFLHMHLSFKILELLKIDLP